MTKRLTILVVEDDASMRRSIGRLLAAAGFQCVEFESAEDLLLSTDLATSDCLITDIHLPGMSGSDLIDQIRSKHAAMPVLFITAYDEAKLREQLLRRSHASYLAKPFETMALLTAIQKICRT